MTRDEALAQLLQGSFAWGRQHGVDPLQTRAAQGPYEAAAALQSPVKQLIDQNAQGLSRVASLTTHGKRAGQAHTSFDYGDGLQAHVYFDPDGKRHVYVFPKPHGPASTSPTQ